MTNFQELRELANQTRSFIQVSGDKARALRVVIANHDVILAIFPSNGKGIDFHVIKGEELLRQIANTNWTGNYTHTAIAVHNREQAIVLQHATAA